MRSVLSPLSRAILCGVALLSLGGCGLLPTHCTQELRVEIRPVARTLEVGHQFTAQATGISCGGRDRFPYAVHWASTDPSVAEVDAGTGVVTGTSAGTVRIRAHDLAAGEWWWGEIEVMVIP